MEIVKKTLIFAFNFPAKIAVRLIYLYQATLSPDHGLFKGKFPYGFCRHYPSCSEYTKQAILLKGLIKGVFLGFVRIIKCNPFAKPKVDQLTY